MIVVKQTNITRLVQVHAACLTSMVTGILMLHVETKSQNPSWAHRGGSNCLTDERVWGPGGDWVA